MQNLKIGISQVDCTPQLGLPLMGNYRQDYAARGVHDPLYAKAMVIADPFGQKVAIMSVDICMLDRDDVAMARNYIASRSDIEAENILIAATHTHSGPALVSIGSLPKADDKSIEAFLKKASETVLAANEELIVSELAVGYTTETRLSFNHRLTCKDNQTHMNWEGLEPEFVVEPLGPVDPEVTTISVLQQDKPAACIVNFGLHPAVLAGDNWLYSADYPGCLAEAMEKLYSVNFKTIFFNGCCGNVNHIDYTDKTQGRGYQMTQRIGYMLAVDAHEAMKKQVKVIGSEIAVSKEKVPLKRFQISEEKKAWAHDVLEKVKLNSTEAAVDGMPDEFYAGLWLEMYEKQSQDDAVEVMVIRVGDIGIIGLPGEPFCEYGMEIKKLSPAKHTLLFELANDACLYFPTEVSFEQGGYESMPGSTKYAKGQGRKLVTSALNQLNKLFS